MLPESRVDVCSYICYLVYINVTAHTQQQQCLYVCAGYATGLSACKNRSVEWCQQTESFSQRQHKHRHKLSGSTKRIKGLRHEEKVTTAVVVTAASQPIEAHSTAYMARKHSAGSLLARRRYICMYEKIK